MSKNYAFLFFILGAIFIAFCKYRVHLIMKKYSKGKSYFALDVKSFEKEDIQKINFWRLVAFITPIIVIIAVFIITVIFKK